MSSHTRRPEELESQRSNDEAQYNRNPLQSASTLPALRMAYTLAQHQIDKLQAQRRVQREKYDNMLKSITIHTAYLYRLANAITLLTEGVRYDASTVPFNIPEQYRGPLLSPRMFVAHMDALTLALESNITRLLNESVVVPREIRSPLATPMPATLELIQTDALTTITAQLSNLSFGESDIVLSPLTFVHPTPSSSTIQFIQHETDQLDAL
jgi:hypothetical protein